VARRSKSPDAGKAGFPSREDVLAYVREADGKVGLREIARRFRLSGGDRMALKAMLASLTEEGTLSGNKKRLKETGTLPPVTVLEVKGRDRDGEVYAEPVTWEEGGERPRALLVARSRAAKALPALGTGDRILARVSRLEDEGAGGDGADGGGYRYEAEPIRQLPREKVRQLGIFRRGAENDGEGGHILPIDRRELKEWSVEPGGAGEAEDGELVRFDLVRARRHHTPTARVVERLGNPADQRQISLIALHAHGLPDAFPRSVLAEVENLPALSGAGRVDLTGLPLVTIDPADARDHDDAVHAAPDDDPGNPGGHVVTVAIADVAHYVRPGTRLDREAETRANSIYFPDRVVPMLPERISNDLCSLREGETRPALAVRMIFDAHGQKRSHRFERVTIRVAVKLAYEEAQKAFDGKPGARAGAFLETALVPLWKAYRALAEARDKRAPLALDLPERKIRLDAEGRVARIEIPQRLEAHRLIEEMMIQANVAAAETLEERRTPCVYRVHDKPTKEKLQSLADFLESLDLRLAKSSAPKAASFNAILERTRGLAVADLVGEVVLRAQAQAEYATENYGHFGLNLRRYAHFTSPIRRYADLLVHRALVRALRFGEGGLEEEQERRLAAIAEAISKTERRTMAAERETTDRLIAAHLADRVGAEFDGRVAGATKVGLFVKLRDTGADGFIPISSLGAEYFRHDETRHALVGERTGRSFRLGDDVRVRLVEAIPTAGALRFEMLSEGTKSHPSLEKSWRGPTRLKGRRPPPPRRGR
jgi:ribonuclease R